MKLLVATLALTLGAAAPSQGRVDEWRPSALSRPIVIGASISAGFSSGRDLAQILDAMIERDHEPIESAFSMLFWRDPISTAESQVGFALENDPTVLVAVDFLFWLGCGPRNLAGDPIESEHERLEMLARGLELLEQFSCPIVIGDFPDYRGALAELMAPASMPSASSLAALNQKLLSWSDARGNVIVLPMSEQLRAIQENEEVVVGGYVCPRGTSSKLLLPDRVHASREGLIWIAHLLTTELIKQGWVESSDVRSDLVAVADELRGNAISNADEAGRLEAIRVIEGGR